MRYSYKNNINGQKQKKYQNINIHIIAWAIRCISKIFSRSMNGSNAKWHAINVVASSSLVHLNASVYQMLRYYFVCAGFFKLQCRVNIFFQYHGNENDFSMLFFKLFLIMITLSLSQYIQFNLFKRQILTDNINPSIEKNWTAYII